MEPPFIGLLRSTPFTPRNVKGVLSFKGSFFWRNHMSKRRFGTLRSWNASEHGGYGHIVTADGQEFFLRREWISSGTPTPGSSAVFSTLPPVPGRPHSRAVDCVLNANTEAARETRMTPRASGVVSPVRAAALLAGRNSS
jgi:hypothetical protein